MTTTTDFDIPLQERQQPEVSSALEDHAQAADYLAALEERVRAGDEGVKPAELRDARGLVEYAGLRVTTARRTATRRQADERAQQYVQAGADARAVTLGDDAIVSAFNEAVTALARLHQLAATRHHTMSELSRRVSAIVDQADQHDERGLLRQAGIHNGGFPERVVTVKPEDGPTYYLTDVAAERVTLAAAARVLQLADEIYQADVTPSGALDLAARVFPGFASAGQ